MVQKRSAIGLHKDHSSRKREGGSMRIGWITRNGYFRECEHTQHWNCLFLDGETPAIKCALNGYAYFEHPANEITQTQLDTLFDWTQEEGAESWEVIADFLGIGRE